MVGVCLASLVLLSWDNYNEDALSHPLTEGKFMPALTATYEFNVPVEGGDVNDWGQFLNENWLKVDALLDGTDPIAPNLVGWSVGGVAITASAPEINFLTGVSANVQTQLDGKQASDAGLTSIAGLTTAADRMLYTTAADTYAVATLTSAGRALLDDADAAAQRATLDVPSTSEAQQNAGFTWLTPQDADLVTGVIGEFTGIPSWATEVIAVVLGIETNNGSGSLEVDIGTAVDYSGTLEGTTLLFSFAANTGIFYNTTGAVRYALPGVGSRPTQSKTTFTKVVGNTWVYDGFAQHDGNLHKIAGGSFVLTAALDRARFSLTSAIATTGTLHVGYR